MGFNSEMIRDIMRLVVAVLYAGNMTFTETSRGETCILDENEASLAVASLLGCSYEKLAASLTSRVLFLKEGNITKELNAKQAYKASEALIKSIYGANFDYIVKVINQSIHRDETKDRRGKDRGKDNSAYIGVLDIFGFETFEINTFEQLCINYTNETLQQHFNKHVFKMEQQEYEREGILWKFISFPDNQDVLDLIDMKRVGILAVLDEQCIVEWGSDDKFVQQLYQRCGPHDRFEATPQQRPYRKFSVDHYAGLVEYSTEEWVEKNKDQLPAASVELLMSSDFQYVERLQVCVSFVLDGHSFPLFLYLAMFSFAISFTLNRTLSELKERVDEVLLPQNQLVQNSLNRSGSFVIVLISLPPTTSDASSPMMSSSPMNSIPNRSLSSYVTLECWRLYVSVVQDTLLVILMVSSCLVTTCWVILVRMGPSVTRI